MVLSFPSSSLIIKNTNNSKAIRILGMKLNPGQTADLFRAVDGLSEARVIAAMQNPNGEIYKAVARGFIIIQSSNFITFQNDSTTSDDLALDFVETITKENLTFTVDYNLVGAVDPPTGTIFDTQSEINDFLASRGATAFKYLQLAYNALPNTIAHDHTVTFNCAAGVHRPVPTQPGLVAWALDSKTCNGNIVVQGASPSLYTPFAGIATGIAITATQAASRDPFVDVADAPFATTAWAATTTYAAGDRRWNGAALGGTSGAAASIGAVVNFNTGQMRLSGLTGMTVDSLGRSITISGAASSGNNGTFPITNFVSATSVDVLNRTAVIPDASNGAISWSGTWAGTATSIVAGAASGRMRLTGLTGMNISAVGHYLTISGAASAANNGTWQIVNFISATSCDVVNAAAVVPDANNGAITWSEKAGNVYQARIGGLSAGSGGPTGTALTDIVDNAVTWRFLQVGPAVLKGSYVIFNTGQAALIHDHTESRLNCMDVISPTPTSITFVGRPSTIFRNSINDTVHFKANTWLNSCNTSRHGFFSTGPYANIKLRDCIIDPFGMNTSGAAAMENGAVQLYAGGSEFLRFILDQDSAIDFPYNRTPSASGILALDGGLAAVTMQSSAHLNRQQSGGPAAILVGDCGVALYGNYFSGAASGVQMGALGHFGCRIGGNVFDSCGNNFAAVAVDHGKFLILFDIGTAGTLGVGKENEFRNTKTGCTPISVNRLGNIHGEVAGQCRATFKNNQSFTQVVVQRGGTCKINGAGTNGLLNGGGNSGYGFQLQDIRVLVHLNASTNVTGAAGDIRMSNTGHVFTYAQLDSAGSINDIAADVILRRP